MRRVGDNRNPVKDKFGPGKNGFGPGNPQTGQMATTPGYELFDSLQEELAGVIEAAGMTLDPNDNNQLRRAIQLLTVPSGAVQYFAMSAAPAGWLVANGTTVSRSTYAALFAAIGTVFGAGDGATTFNLPDLRGEFIRGWSYGRSVDSGRGMGSWQDQSIQAHAHNYYTVSGAEGGIPTATPTAASKAMGLATTTESGSAETRPRNVALLVCIKI